MRLKGLAAWLLAALLFAAVVLPFLVYCTGVVTLGPYANGGPGRFVLDFYRSLGALSGAAWLLLLGPAVLVLLGRILFGYAWRGNRIELTHRSE